MHALGFHHEHTRPDRDQYIKVDEEMLERYMPGRVHNYRVLPASIWDVSGHAFELNSIMNYNSQKWMTTQDKVLIFIFLKYFLY